MEPFVLDVSACMPWCCEDEATPASERMLSWAIDANRGPRRPVLCIASPVDARPAAIAEP
jgi:hypothetical protein